MPSSSAESSPSETPPLVERARQRNRWRRMRGALLALVAMASGFFVLLACLLGLLQVDWGRDVLGRLLGELIAGVSGMTVRIEGLAPGAPLKVAFDRLSVADGDGQWLTIDDFELRWRPASLIRGKVIISDLSAKRIVVERRPAANRLLPMITRLGRRLAAGISFNVRVDHLSVDSLALAAPVMGRSAAFCVQGGIGATAGASIATDIAFSRIDGGAANGSILARLDPTTSRLRLALAFDEALDGLVAAAIGLEQAPPLHFALTGEGPVDAWEGQLEARLGELVTLGADLRLRGETGRQIQVEGRALWPNGPPEAIPAVLRPSLADGVTFLADAELGETGPITVKRLTLGGRDISVTATGEVAPEDDRIDLDLHAALGPSAFDRGVIAGFSLQSAATEGKASGALSAPDIRGRGVIEGAGDTDVRVGRLDWAASARPAAGDGAAEGGYALQLDATAHEVESADPRLRPLLGSDARLTMTAMLGASRSVLEIRNLAAQLSTMQLGAAGVLALDAGDSGLDLTLTADDLGRLGSVAGVPLAGRGRVAVTLSGPITQGQILAKVVATLDGFSTRQSVVQAAMGTHPTATADVTFDRASGLEVTQCHLVGQAITARGHGTLNERFDVLSGEIEAEARDVRPLAAAAGVDATGGAQLGMRMQGAIADPEASVAVRWLGGRIAGIGVDSGRLDAEANSLGAHPSGDLRINASTSLGPIDFASKFEQPSPATLDLHDLRASLFGVQAEGGLVVETATGLVRGRIVGALPQTTGRVSQGVLRGEATFDVSLAPERQAQAIDGRLRGASLRSADGGEGGVRIGSLRLDIHVADAFGRPQVRADARVGGMRLAGEGPFEGRMTASGPADRLMFDVALTGATDRLGAADIHGWMDASTSPVRAEISQLTGTVATYRLGLRRPATIAGGRGQLTLEDLDLAIGEGSLRGHLDFRPGVTLVSLNGEDVPLRVVAPWFSGIPAGQVSLETDLQSTGSEVSGALSARIEDLRLNAAQGAQKSSGRADIRGTLSGGILDVTGDAGLNGGASFSFSSRLPVTVRPGVLAVQLQKDAGFVAGLQLEADLSRFRDVVGLPDQQLAGTLTGDFHAAGALGHPSISGRAALVGGRYENIVTGTLLTPIEGHLEASANESVVVMLTAGTKDGGSIAVEGNAATSATKGGPAIDLSIKADQAQVVHRDDLIVTTNASLRYRGNLVHGILSGTLEPTTVEVHLLDRLPPSVVVIPVIEINRPLGELLPESFDSEKPWVADMDISLDMPQQVFVRGRGLDSEWAGRLHIGGSTAAPRLTGTVDVVHGTFTFANKRFHLHKGSVVFTGGRPIDPTLDIAATTRTPDLKAVIGVTGTALDPKLGITSQPPLPEREVLAQVLFGKSSSRLGPVEAAQLSAAIASLVRGESWSDNLLGTVRKFLGLDVLDADDSISGYGGNNQSTLRTNHYDNAAGYTGTAAKQGLTGPSTSDTVEVEITPWLSLQSDLTQNAEGMAGSIGLRWKHDY